MGENFQGRVEVGDLVGEDLGGGEDLEILGSHWRQARGKWNLEVPQRREGIRQVEPAVHGAEYAPRQHRRIPLKHQMLECAAKELIDVIHQLLFTGDGVATTVGDMCPRRQLVPCRREDQLPQTYAPGETCREPLEGASTPTAVRVVQYPTEGGVELEGECGYAAHEIIREAPGAEVARVGHVGSEIPGDVGDVGASGEGNNTGGGMLAPDMEVSDEGGVALRDFGGDGERAEVIRVGDVGGIEERGGEGVEAAVDEADWS